MDSTTRTTSPLASLPALSSSHLSLTTYDGEGPKIPRHEAAIAEVVTPNIRRKGGVHNLRRYRSSADIEDLARTVDTPSPKILRRRRLQRSQSADDVLPSRRRFHSPDRYISQRMSPLDVQMPFRTSQSPETLHKSEQRSRQRDQSRGFFNTFSLSKHHSSRGQGLQRNGYSFRPPHYLPSFIYGNDARPLPVNADPNQTTTNTINTEGWPTNHSPSDRLEQLHAVDTGMGYAVASTTNAPHHSAEFLRTATQDDRILAHADRVALAMDINRARRTVLSSPQRESPSPAAQARMKTTVWQDSAWLKASDPVYRSPGDRPPTRKEKTLPTVPFRVLDAPNLKDDYYCSVLAYDRFSATLAVALTQKVYLWTELRGVRSPPLGGTRPSNYVTGLSFSSEEGQRSFLAISRQSGKVTIWSIREKHPHFEYPHPCPATCVAFRPRPIRRLSAENCRYVECEELVVGGDDGRLYYYTIECPGDAPGCMTLQAKIEAHTQNVCGIAWSADGRRFATGGNDNKVYLFAIDDCVFPMEQFEDKPLGKGSSVSTLADRMKFLRVASTAYFTPQHSTITSLSGEGPDHERFEPGTQTQPTRVRVGPDLVPRPRITPHPSVPGGARNISSHTKSPLPRPILRNKLVNPDVRALKNQHEQVFCHSAAVKAIAFAPWQPTLLATGGGSNDRQIHFHHTVSGATLAVISVNAQVTSLTWSTTRREIAATFGYAQPEHPVRIAVFEWPSCECVVSIPWERKPNGEFGRALWAIPYPGGPNDPMIEQIKRDAEGLGAWAALQRTRNAERPVQLDPTRQTGALRSTSAPMRVISAQAHNLLPRPSPRGEGEVWASRTHEEGSLIIASCDQTVKFFEIWSGRSKGNGKALGRKEGVLGGSRVLEGWSKNMMVDEVGHGEETIR